MDNTTCFLNCRKGFIFIIELWLFKQRTYAQSTPLLSRENILFWKYFTTKSKEKAVWVERWGKENKGRYSLPQQGVFALGSRFNKRLQKCLYYSRKVMFYHYYSDWMNWRNRKGKMKEENGRICRGEFLSTSWKLVHVGAQVDT